MAQTPILFLGDSPELSTGLARIGRDIAYIASTMPELRVGYLGRGGIGSIKLPFAQYNYQPSVMSEWGEIHLSQVWNEFVGGDRASKQPAVLFTIWDPSRVTWVGSPDFGPTELMTADMHDVQRTLTDPRMRKWGYFAIDSVGAAPDGGMTEIVRHSLHRYDRLLAYSRFGLEVMERSCPGIRHRMDWLPHGINTKTFVNCGLGARTRFGWNSEHFVVGCVMTNQPRKDWGLWIETINALSAADPNMRFWAHVDTVDRHWDLRALVTDFGLQNVVKITTDHIPDSEMPYYYSMCNVTILPSLGEGFGYPIAESLSCGVPVVHGSYGAGAEIIPEKLPKPTPTAFRIDTRYNVVRPVYNPADWFNAICEVQDMIEDGAITAEECRESVKHLDWKKLAPIWKRWLREGIERS